MNECKEKLKQVITKNKNAMKDYVSAICLEKKDLEDRIACIAYLKMEINEIDEAVKEYRREQRINNVISHKN